MKLRPGILRVGVRRSALRLKDEGERYAIQSQTPLLRTNGTLMRTNVTLMGTNGTLLRTNDQKATL